MGKYAIAVVVLAGDQPKCRAADDLRQFAAADDTLVVAADGGAAHCLALGITPAVIIGDMDSLPPEIDRLLAEIPRLTLPCRKNFTDGAATLDYALKHCAGEVLVFGALGGRPDHFFANLLLPLNTAAESRVRLRCDDGWIFYSTGGELMLEGEPGDTVSIVPLTTVRGLTLQGLEYPLEDYTASPGDSRTMCNILVHNTALIKHDSGILLVFLLSFK